MPAGSGLLAKQTSCEPGSGSGYLFACERAELRTKRHRISRQARGIPGPLLDPQPVSVPRPCGPITFSNISFGMCLNLMSWVQQVHNAAVVALNLRGALDKQDHSTIIAVITLRHTLANPCSLIRVTFVIHIERETY